MEYLPLVFGCIAFLYSSIGFGGGSSYLAILSLFLSDFFEIRSTALILNVTVVIIGTFAFVRQGVFDGKRFWPFLALSVPMAYLGATVRLSERDFFLVLGGALLLSGLTMLLRIAYRRHTSRELTRGGKLAFGGGIGFLSGISGIGGGIFLSPALNLFRWANPRVVAALSSVFILVNSLSGLLGLSIAGTLRLDSGRVVPLILSVMVGGATGSYLSGRTPDTRWIAGLTAVLVMYVGLRLLLLHGFGLSI